MSERIALLSVSSDASFVGRLAAELRAQGFEVTDVAREVLHEDPQSEPAKLRRHLESVDHTIIVLSPDALASDQMRGEIEFAALVQQSGERPRLLVAEATPVAPETYPYSLRGRTKVAFAGVSYDNSLIQLVSKLHGTIPQNTLAALGAQTPDTTTTPVSYTDLPLEEARMPEDEPLPPSAYVPPTVPTTDAADASAPSAHDVPTKSGSPDIQIRPVPDVTDLHMDITEVGWVADHEPEMPLADATARVTLSEQPAFPPVSTPEQDLTDHQEASGVAAAPIADVAAAPPSRPLYVNINENATSSPVSGPLLAQIPAVDASATGTPVVETSAETVAAEPTASAPTTTPQSALAAAQPTQVDNTQPAASHDVGAAPTAPAQLSQPETGDFRPPATQFARVEQTSEPEAAPRKRSFWQRLFGRG